MYEEPALFSDDEFFEEGSQEVDETEIKMTLLYYSLPEFKDFKRLCKIAIADHLGDRRFEDGNISDILLHILKEKYDKDN